MDKDDKFKILNEIAEIRTMLKQLGAVKPQESKPQIPTGKTGVRTLFLF